MDGAGSISNCAVVALAAGSGNSRTAACTTTTLAVGTHSVAARYSGDAANSTSTSDTVSETITGTPPALGSDGFIHTVEHARRRAASHYDYRQRPRKPAARSPRSRYYLNGAKLADLTVLAVHVHHDGASRWHAPVLRDGHRCTRHGDVDADAERRRDFRAAAGGHHGREHLALAEPGNVRCIAIRGGEGQGHGHRALDRQPVRAADIGIPGHEVQRDLAQDHPDLQDAGPGRQGLSGGLAAGNLCARPPDASP